MGIADNAKKAEKFQLLKNQLLKFWFKEFEVALQHSHNNVHKINAGESRAQI